MRRAGDQVGHTVLIYIMDIDESHHAQIEFGMERPAAIAGIRRSLKPALGSDDVIPAVSIDVARSDSMTVALRTDFMSNPVGASAAVRKFVPGKRSAWVAELGQNLSRLAGVQQIHEECKLNGITLLNHCFAPWA